MLLGCALRRPEVAALTDGRWSGGCTLEATVAARHADAPELTTVYTTALGRMHPRSARCQRSVLDGQMSRVFGLLVPPVRTSCVPAPPPLHAHWNHVNLHGVE
jgi:hypothetical protein